MKARYKNGQVVTGHDGVRYRVQVRPHAWWLRVLTPGVYPRIFSFDTHDEMADYLTNPGGGTIAEYFCKLNS